jgi:hypothetical protein
MTLVFSGVLAAAFYTLVFGAIWPARDGSDFSVALLGQIAKSLWLSWLVVVVSYWLNLTIPLPMLLGAVVVSLAYQWLRKPSHIVLSNPVATVLVLIGAAGLCLFLYNGGFTSDYRLIFMTTDAVESWNKWAIELSRNTYNPYNTAYPLLFPGIWSLVYKAQGASTVWIFAKLTLFVGPVILAGTVCLLISSRFFIAAMIYAGFVVEFFFYSHSFPMLLGDADIPVTIMCLAAGILMVVAIDKIERGKSLDEIVILAALFSGLASITKQQGMAMLPPLLLLIAAGLWNRKLSRLDALISFGVAAIPLATFLSMFLTQQPDPFGSWGYLQDISAAANKSPLAAALHHLETMLPAWMLAALSLLALANLFYLRRLSGQMSILFLVLGIVGFFSFAKCCSYDPRNGWWTISLLATSAMFCVTRFDSSEWFASRVIKIRTGYLPTTLAAFAIIVAFIAQYRLSDDRALSAQLQEQEIIAGYEVGPMLKELQPVLKSGGVLLTEYSMARWVPGMINHVAVCGWSDKNCIRNAFGAPAGDRIFVLIRRGVLEFPTLNALLKPERQMRESGGFELYGPFNAGDAAAIN